MKATRTAPGRGPHRRAGPHWQPAAELQGAPLRLRRGSCGSCGPQPAGPQPAGPRPVAGGGGGTGVDRPQAAVRENLLRTRIPASAARGACAEAHPAQDNRHCRDSPSRQIRIVQALWRAWRPPPVCRNKRPMPCRMAENQAA